MKTVKPMTTKQIVRWKLGQTITIAIEGPELEKVGF